MELLICIDALRRASARRITAVIPYFGYARQDRKPGPRTPISAKLVANLITRAGANRVLTVDLHAGQIQGFFDIPTDNLFASPVFATRHPGALRHRDLIVVSPDVGGVVRARGLAKRLRTRRSPSSTSAASAPASREVMNIIGDVGGRTCILVDDIVDFGGTLCNAAEALKQQGAHSKSSPNAPTACSRAARRRASPASKLKELVVTDSICTGEPDRRTARSVA